MRHRYALALSAVVLAGIACSLVEGSEVETEAPAATTTAPAATATAVPPTRAPATPSVPTPRIGHYEGGNPTISFDLTRRGVDAFMLIVPFGPPGQTTTCTIGPLEGTLALTGNSFSLEQFAGDIQALVIEGTITGTSTGSSAMGTYSISLCGNLVTAPPAAGLWNAEWRGAGAEPTEAPPGAALPEVYLRPFCECTETAELGQAVYLRWGWVATTGELTQAYVDASTQRVWIDGSQDPVLVSIGDSDWSGITWNEDYQGYASYWSWQLPALPRGSHRIEIEVTLSEAVSDGYDTDGDGEPDVYGPGVVQTGWVELVIH